MGKRQAFADMSTSRQARRQLGRSLKALGKAPLEEFEACRFDSEMGIVAGDVKLAAGRCAACLSTSNERKSCHACGFVRYCNRECQTAGWPSHKLVCRVLAADREIASSPQLSESAPLLPLATIWERLRSGGHAEAYEATAHFWVWVDRCGVQDDTASGSDHVKALRAEIAASGGIALLVKGLAAGGLRAAQAAELLDTLTIDHPETGAALFAAGAIPPLIHALALPFKHAEFGGLWSFREAAEDAAALIDSFCSESPAAAKAFTATEGVIPALTLHLNYVMQEDAFSQPHWPDRSRGLKDARYRAIGALLGLVTCGDAGDEDAASFARACVAGGAASPLVACVLMEDFTLVGNSAIASECLTALLQRSGDVALARQLGGDIVNVIIGTRDGAELLEQIVRLAPECRAAAEERAPSPS